MKIQGYVFFISVLASAFFEAACGDNIYCHVSKNEFYLLVGNLCKKCDRCMPGLELIPEEEATFEISIDHGALGCRHCVVCQKGYFNNKWTYRGCRKCKNCEEKGKITVEKCTSKSNTKCGKRVAAVTTVSKSPTKYTGMTTAATVTYPNASAKETTHNRGGSTVSIEVVVVTLLIVTLFVVIILFAAKHFPHRLCIVRKTSRNSSYSTGLDVNDSEMADVEEDGEIPPNTACINPVENKYEISEDYNSPTERQLMFVSKRIAARKGYWQIGIYLDVGEHNICRIEDENSNESIRISFKVLQKWTQMCTEPATVSQLLATLDVVQRNDIVVDFYEEFKDIFQNNSKNSFRELSRP